ncbi:hypothetical protein QJS10_CPA03g00450 [Acorus calamus]|uniref:Uncharacterized protein n=1 Tax=Acorus calamus TaxID=4465 RepID=A0AAV9FB97_ACOCL|nr:hypothetical protein QJS10_CPA03g00450 [Acorus calamus]
MEFYVKEINYTTGYLFIPCANTSKEKAYITGYSSVNSLESSCRHVASLPVTNDSSYFYSLETVVPRVLANGFNYRWSEKRQGCKTKLSERVFQCLKNATSPPQDLGRARLRHQRSRQDLVTRGQRSVDALNGDGDVAGVSFLTREEMWWPWRRLGTEEEEAEMDRRSMEERRQRAMWRRRERT